MGKSKYTDNQIEQCVKDGLSFNHAHILLTGGSSGSSYVWFKNRVIKLGLDTSHFDPARRSREASKNRKPFDLSKILVYNEKLVNRIKTPYLVRALLENGTAYRCGIVECGIDLWLGQPITLDVDHIDGNWRNNKIENLRFLCGNCHKQTESYGNKTK